MRRRGCRPPRSLPSDGRNCGRNIARLGHAGCHPSLVCHARSVLHRFTRRWTAAVPHHDPATRLPGYPATPSRPATLRASDSVNEPAAPEQTCTSRNVPVPRSTDMRFPQVRACFIIPASRSGGGWLRPGPCTPKAVTRQRDRPGKHASLSERVLHRRHASVSPRAPPHRRYAVRRGQKARSNRHGKKNHA